MKYKVLLIGNGGRESAIAYSLKKSPLLKSLKVYIGNASFEKDEIIEENELDILNKKKYQSFITNHKFDLVVVGPEVPLVNGISDWTKEVNILCFGPSQFCAQIEGSKKFAKEFMKECDIKTANYEVFQNYEDAIFHLEKSSFPTVLKLDGLAAGKGVLVCESLNQGKNFLDEIFLKNTFGKNPKLIIEDFLQGVETSIFAVCDGKDYMLFPPSQDYKRAYEDDKGPNTGGMGSFCPKLDISPKMLEKIKLEVFDKIFQNFSKKNKPYQGLLYAGLMIDKDENIKVLEFNCRFGDPETQSILPLMETDLLDVMIQSASGKFQIKKLEFSKKASCCVVVASKGYPNSYKKNIKVILNNDEKVLIFYAGIKRVENYCLSNGGRILSVVSLGDSLEVARDRVYSYLEDHKIDDTFYRKDIARRF